MHVMIERINRARLTALHIELRAVEELLARRDELYGFELDYWTQRRRALITEQRALETYAQQTRPEEAQVDKAGADPRLAHGVGPVRLAHAGADPRRAHEGEDARLAHVDDPRPAHQEDDRQEGPL